MPLDNKPQGLNLVYWSIPKAAREAQVVYDQTNVYIEKLLILESIYANSVEIDETAD